MNTKKIILLSSVNSIHTIRWANGLNKKGLIVHVISIHNINPQNIAFDPNVHIHILKNKAPLGYITATRELKKLIADINPDLLNAHYATGYGLLARLSRFHPLLLSVWGSDVYDFPNKSFIHRLFLKFNLKNADAIASTSHCMARQTLKTYPYKSIYITPFGIDEIAFAPQPDSRIRDEIWIGTVKTLSEKYGIDTLIQTFALAIQKTPIKLKLSIYGQGSDEEKLKKLAQSLGIADKVIFHGFIPHHKVSEALNQLDIYIALSREESFGVAILEASSCGKPVIVSDAEGLKEVVLDGKTGFIVPKNDPQAACNVLIKLIENKELRESMGYAGREHVLSHYTWDKSLDLMITAYKKTIGTD